MVSPGEGLAPQVSRLWRWVLLMSSVTLQFLLSTLGNLEYFGGSGLDEQKLECVGVGGMENILQLVERQRERKANRSVAISHNSSGSDVHSGATFTVGSLNTTHDVDINHRLLSIDEQQPKHGAIYTRHGSVTVVIVIQL